MTDGNRMFEIIRGNWRNAASEPRTWYGIVTEGTSRLIIARSKEGGREAEKRQRKRDVDDGNRVVIALRVTAGKLRRFRASLIDPLPVYPKRRQLHRYRCPRIFVP